jgi:hypothetical protein
MEFMLSFRLTFRREGTPSQTMLFRRLLSLCWARYCFSERTLLLHWRIATNRQRALDIPVAKLTNADFATLPQFAIFNYSSAASGAPPPTAIDPVFLIA